MKKKLSFSSLKRWPRRKEYDIDEDGIYHMTWTEDLPFATRSRSFVGSKQEILFLLEHLEQKGPIFTELDIYQIPKHTKNPPKAEDGHYHMVDGQPQYHLWEDCPENYRDSNWICGGYMIDTKPRN